MQVARAIEGLRQGQNVQWPTDSSSLSFAQTLDQDANLRSFRDQFIIPSKADLRRKSLHPSRSDQTSSSPPSSSSPSRTARQDKDDAIYFCGNSLGLQPRAVSEYLSAYLQTWATIAVGAHFTPLQDSPLAPFQDLAAECARKSADIVGADANEIVIMNTLTVNLHLMMAAFYRPTQQKKRIMIEWRPFPSDYYAVESQIEWHGLDPKECMLLVQPDDDHLMTTEHILSLIDQHADELALILLPGIQYYSGQLLDIPTITAHAHSKGILIGWDLAHAAGNVELKLHDWDVDFACWCTYKYMNAGAGAIAGAFVHSKHGNVDQNHGLRGWYGGDKSVRFQMDNKFVPTPGAQGFQLSNPSAIDLTSLSASLSVFNQTSMSQLRSKSLLLTAYAEHLLEQISSRVPSESKSDDSHDEPFRIITPTDPRFRGAQLSVLIREDLMDAVSAALEDAGIVCDKRKPGCIRVAPAPLYNTFEDIWRFMETFEKAFRQTETNEDDSRREGDKLRAELDKELQIRDSPREENRSASRVHLESRM